MGSTSSRCEAHYEVGPRAGERCRAQARYTLAPKVGAQGDPRRLCGDHARAWLPWALRAIDPRDDARLTARALKIAAGDA